MDDCRQSDGELHREKDREHRHQKGAEAETRKEGQTGSKQSRKADDKIFHLINQPTESNVRR